MIPVVSVILLNRRREVLLQLRDDKPDLLCAGMWTLPGGYMHPSETPLQAITREMQEEMELTLPLTYWKAYQAQRGHDDEIIVWQHLFTGQLEQDAKLLPLHEGQAVRFFSREAITEMELAFGFQPVLLAYFDHREE